MDIVQQLETEHRRFFELLQRLEDEVLDSDHKYAEGWTQAAGGACLRILNELIPEMARHEEIERRILFPELEKRLPVTAEVFKSMEHEHEALDRLLEGFMAELPKSGEKPTSWIVLNLLKLSGLLQRHMRHEEQDLFSVAKENMPHRTLAHLGHLADDLRAAGTPKEA